MAKQLRFLQIGEKREAFNYLSSIQRLIQVQVSHKTTLRKVIDVIEKETDGDEESEVATAVYVASHMQQGHRLSDLFLELNHFMPEEGVNVYAIFELRDI